MMCAIVSVQLKNGQEHTFIETAGELASILGLHVNKIVSDLSFPDPEKGCMCSVDLLEAARLSGMGLTLWTPENEIFGDYLFYPHGGIYAS